MLAALGLPAGALAHQFAEPNPPVLAPTDEPKTFGLRPFGPELVAPLMEWTYHKTADGSHPNGDEQRMLWLMNRARQDPPAEGVWLATTTVPDIANGRGFFSVNTTALTDAFDALPARAPAAFDARLYAASRDHSLDLIARDAQDHAGQFTKVGDSGFNCNGGRVSVFSYASSALNAHGALNIDWGYDTDGMQSPPGHRYAIMDVDASPLVGVRLTNVGLAVVPDHDTSNSVGPTPMRLPTSMNTAISAATMSSSIRKNMAPRPVRSKPQHNPVAAGPAPRPLHPNSTF